MGTAGPTPTFVGANTSEMAASGTDMTVPLPAEVQPGDMMIVYVKNNGSSSAVAPVSPEGWTYLGSTAAANYYHVFWRYRTAGGNPEPTFIMPAAGRHQAHVVAYRNVGDISTPSTTTIAAGTYTYTHPNVATTLNNSVVVYARDFVTTGASGSFAWNGATERTDTSFTYATGLTNIISVADVEVPAVGSSSGVQSIVTGGVSNGSTRPFSYVLNPVYNSKYQTPQFVNTSDVDSSLVSSTTLNVAVPSGSATGDLMIMIARSTTASITTPSGWTFLGSQVRTGTSVMNAYWKRVAAGDTSFTVTYSAASNSHAVLIHTYAKAGGVGDFVSASATTTNPTTMPVVTTKFENSLIMYAQSSARSGTTAYSGTWTGATERFQSNFAASSNYYAFTSAGDTKVLPGTSSTVTLNSSLAPSSSARFAIIIRPVNNVPILTAKTQVKNNSTGTGSQTRYTANIPAEVQDGDVLVSYSTMISGTSGTKSVSIDTSVSGTAWIPLEIYSSVNQNIYIAKKTWRTGDPMTISWAMPAWTYAYHADVYVFKNADIDKIALGAREVTTSGTVSTIGITTTTNENYILAFESALNITTTTRTHVWTGDVVEDFDSEQASPTSARRSLHSTASAVQIDAGTFPNQTVTLSNTTAEKHGILISVPGLPLVGAYNGSAFLPFFGQF